MHEARLRVEGISKSFPGVRALDNVTFEVHAGTVHALCGENGAGKSTLMKIVDGLYQPDAGTIRVNGHEVSIKQPTDAKHLGIAMISQELHHVPEMTVAENFFIGQLPRRRSRIDWRHIRREARKILDREELPYRPEQQLRTLTVSDIQMLEVLRAVYHRAEILIMDEPTSAITQRDVERLFTKIDALRRQGVAIIYISHKLDEVFQIANQVTVLRDGQVVSTDSIEDITRDQVIERMVGRRIDSQYPKQDLPVGDVVLEVRKLHRHGVFEDINLDVRAGEIVGVAGLVGAGRSEVVRAVFGLDPLDGGTVTVAGRQVHLGSPRRAIEAGVAMLSEDRRLVGIVPQLSVKKNATLASLKKVFSRGVHRRKEEERLVTDYFNLMRVKTPSTETPIENLSGGNQQKVLLARWLLTGPRVMLLDEPTRGIDVGAKYEIYRLMTRLAEQGRGVLMISSELPELIGMCDRIYVMAGGRITGELTTDDFSQETILRYAMSDFTEAVA